MARSTQQRVVVLLSLAAATLLVYASSGAVAEVQATETIDRAPSGASYAAGELLVVYKEDPEESGDVPRDAEVADSVPALDAQLLEFPEIQGEASQEEREAELGRAREELEGDPRVESVDYNYVYAASSSPNDPRFGEQWGLKKVRFADAWRKGRGAGVRVAVVDSGADVDHPDLRRNISDKRDFRNEGSPDTVVDYFGHGTHIAGTVAAETDNGRGVAGGCPRCSLVIAKAMGSTGTGYNTDIAEAIVWSADRGADVINLSLNGPDSDGMREAVAYARSKGAVVVASAGNGSAQPYPASYPGVIAVASTDRSDRRASDSKRGSWVDVAAPGVGILSTVPGGYDYYDGTSMSAAHVSALAGLLADGGYDRDAIRRRITRTAVDLGARGRDPYYGAGRIDAARAVR